MRVLLTALALCAIAFALNLVGDFSASSPTRAAPVRAEIPPTSAGAEAAETETIHTES